MLQEGKVLSLAERRKMGIKDPNYRQGTIQTAHGEIPIIEQVPDEDETRETAKEPQEPFELKKEPETLKRAA